MIQVEDNQTHVVVDEGASSSEAGDRHREATRKKIRDVLKECFNSF